MPKYVALLRAINVGGSKIIKMTDLARCFTGLGFKDVKTYIQTGNVVFESPEKDGEALVSKIVKGLKKSFKQDISVLVRTSGEMAGIVKSDPWTKEKKSPELKTYVAFLSGEPDKALAKAFLGLSEEKEMFRLRGRDLYVLQYRKDGEKSRFSNAWAESKLKVVATTRNWNSVVKLSGM